MIDKFNQTFLTLGLICGQNVFTYLWPMLFPYFAIQSQVQGKQLTLNSFYYSTIFFQLGIAIINVYIPFLYSSFQLKGTLQLSIITWFFILIFFSSYNILFVFFTILTVVGMLRQIIQTTIYLFMRNYFKRQLKLASNLIFMSQIIGQLIYGFLLMVFLNFEDNKIWINTQNNIQTDNTILVSTRIEYFLYFWSISLIIGFLSINYVKEPQEWPSYLSSWLSRRNNKYYKEESYFEPQTTNKKVELFIDTMDENSLSFVTHNSKQTHEQANNTLFSNIFELQSIDDKINKIAKDDIESDSEKSIRGVQIEDPPESFFQISPQELKELIIQKKFIFLTILSAIRNTSCIYFFLNSKRIGLILFSNDFLVNKLFLCAIPFQLFGYILVKKYWRSISFIKLSLIAMLFNGCFDLLSSHQLYSINLYIFLLMMNRFLLGAYYVYDSSSISTLYYGHNITTLNKVFNCQFSLCLIVGFLLSFFFGHFLDGNLAHIFGVLELIGIGILMIIKFN